TIAHNSEVGGLVRLYTQLSADATDSQHPAHSYFTQRYASLRETMTAEIESSQRAGTLREDIGAERLATLVSAAMDGLQTQWLLDPSIDMTAAVSTIIDLASA